MDQNKIKKCFNSVNVSNLPTAIDILQKFEKESTSKKINLKLFTISTLCLSFLTVFIILLIINLPKPTPPNPTKYNTIEVTPSSFNLLYDLTIEETDDDKLNINFKKKLSNAEYNDVEVTIRYILQEEEQLSEYIKTIKLNNINNLILNDSKEIQIEKINIIDTKGNVLVNNNDYQEILSQQDLINSFYDKLNSYNTNSYIYDFSSNLDYYLVDYDDKNNKIESILKDINEETNYLGYKKEHYYRLEAKSKLNNTETKIDNIIMDYMNIPTYIKNIYETTPNGKYGIKLDAYDSLNDAVDVLYEKNQYFNIETLMELLSKDNLNLAGIKINKIISNENKDNLVYKYELTGLFNNFYLLDEKMFNSDHISESTYKKFYNDEITLIITMDNSSISLEIDFENNDNIYGYKSNYPLTPDELKNQDNLEIIKKFEYSIKLFEKFTFSNFNELSLNNYINNDKDYTYLPAENIKDVYKEIKINENIHIESYNQLKTSYFKIYLPKGQYYLHDVTEKFSHTRKVYLYNENKELINLGIHNNDIYFHNLSSTFVVENDGYYYIGVEGGQNEIDFKIDKINNETYEDNGYSSEIEYMPIITTNYFENQFNPLYNHPVYLKLETYQYGQYTFNIEDASDKINYELLDENFNKISNIYNDSKLVLEEGIYILKAISYYPDGSLFNIKYKYSEIIEENFNYREFEYLGGNMSFEFEFSSELDTLIFEYHITFNNDYIVDINNYHAAQFIMEVRNNNEKTLLISDWGNLFRKGTYKFIFTARTTLSTCPKLTISEKNNCKDPYDVSNESYISINDNQITNNYDFITNISNTHLNLFLKQTTVNRVYIVFKIENTTTINFKNYCNETISLKINSNFSTRIENEFSIQLEKGIHLIELRGYVSEYNIDISI